MGLFLKLKPIQDYGGVEKGKGLFKYSHVNIVKIYARRRLSEIKSPTQNTTSLGRILFRLQINKIIKLVNTFVDSSSKGYLLSLIQPVELIAAFLLAGLFTYLFFPFAE